MISCQKYLVKYLALVICISWVGAPVHATENDQATKTQKLPEISLDLRTCQRAVVSHRPRADVNHQHNLPSGVTLSDQLGRSEFKLELDRQILATTGFDRFFPPRSGPFPLGMLSWKQGKLYLNEMQIGQSQYNFVEDLCFRLFPDKL